MTSRRIEDVHRELLDKLLSDSGFECIRSPPESSETSSTVGTPEEASRTKVEEELVAEPAVEEETATVVVAESLVSLPEVFPTPSLQLVLSDKARAIEKQNRIHVLPAEFKTEIDPQAIPRILYTSQQKFIETLAEIVGCTEYKSSLAEFWFLDTLANLLRRAQEDELDRPTQATLISWFCEWIKEMQHFDAADRKRMMRRFQDTMLAAAKVIAKEDYLPTPAQAGLHYKALEEPAVPVTPPIKQEPQVTFEGSVFECCLKDLTKILHYIFDLLVIRFSILVSHVAHAVVKIQSLNFSSDYQYNLVRSIFTFTPGYIIIDAPSQIQQPKRLYAPLKPRSKKSEKSPRKDTLKGKGKKKELESEYLQEYLSMLDKKAKGERELEELEDRDREVWNRKSHILPLSFAATDEFFNQYWPPPPPEPEPEPVVETKGKGKGRAKK